MTSSTSEKKGSQPLAQCPVCSSPDARGFASMPNVPVFCNQLSDSREIALAMPRGDIELYYCPQCTHVFNAAFDPRKLEYSQAYENSLHFSGTFQQYAQELAMQLIERHGIRKQIVVDIGCGKGDFLSMLCDAGDNTGYGFDPSYEDNRDELQGHTGFSVIRDLYSEKYADTRANLISCRHVLEHIQTPGRMLSAVEKSIGDRADCIVFFEVPNVLYTLRDMGIWDLIYEHCGYFTPTSLCRAFELSGFCVLREGTAFAEQFITIEASLSSADTEPERYSRAATDEMEPLIEAFRSERKNKVGHWSDLLNNATRDGKRVVVWGAGSKGVTFLNVTDTNDIVEYIVDINPHKEGKFVAGGGQQIVKPEHLTMCQPDIVIVMNAAYEQEIRDTLSALGITPEVVSA